ncbi:dimethylsulfonioproprionate lyase family protein [Granulicella sp. S190]|uniref:cupin domain-containing protein n=1 Tax=Granulicella sp. S190 TaxID=1747226 RepID=UPI00131C9B76|nr:cupin domain-containing protein [Granulicella sp. S190]
MKPVTTFKVFGEDVDVLVDAAMSRDNATVLIQTMHPGGGPPPHKHTNEDETFTVLEGDFEFLQEGEWTPLRVSEVIFAPRGHIHSFRNSGTTVGRVLIFVSPGGFERYLQEIGPLSPANDMPKIIEISNRYGITFHHS